MKRRLVVAVVVLLIALGLLACGRAGSTGGGSGGSASQDQAGPGQGGSSAGGGGAADYPSDTVVFFTSGVGSGLDLTARTIIEVIRREKLMEEVPVVENRTGGTAVYFPTFVNEYGNDPHYVLINSMPILSNYVNGVMPNSFRDVKPIARLFSTYYMFAVDADSDIESFTDMVERLKADPGSIRFAGANPGSDDWTAGAAVFAATGINMHDLTYAGFEGGGEVITAVLGGHADVGISGVDEFLAQIEAGELRALAVTSEQRLEALPDVPTVKEQGYDVVWDNFRGAFGGAGMPDEIVDWWQDLFARMVETPSWKEMLDKYKWGNTFLADGFTDFLAEREEHIRTILQHAGVIQ